MEKKEIRIATIDLYNNEANEGMRCIGDLVREAGLRHAAHTTYKYDIFETRYKGDIPRIEDYDIFVSSGGPGSPFGDDGKQWETDYFRLLENIWSHNQNHTEKKYIFFICHSFQMMARYFKFANVTERHRKSFGIWQFRKTSQGGTDSLLRNLNDPFYAADFRQYQVVQPNLSRLAELGGTILSTEIDHADGHEPAVMAVRLSDEVAGTQFHPEADADSMIYHFRQEERKKYITELFGEKMYYQMLDGLEDPDKIKLTRQTVIPGFLDNAFNKLTGQVN